MLRQRLIPNSTVQWCACVAAVSAAVIFAVSMDTAARGWTLVYRIGLDITQHHWLVDRRILDAMLAGPIAASILGFVSGAIAYTTRWPRGLLCGAVLTAGFICAYVAAGWSSWGTPESPCFAAGFDEVVALCTALAVIPSIGLAAAATLIGYLVAKGIPG